MSAKRVPNRTAKTPKEWDLELPEGFDPGAYPVPPLYPSERDIREIMSSSTDALSALIRRVRVRSVVPHPCAFSAPWGLCMNAPTGGFFVVRSGSMHVRTEGGDLHKLGEGDAAVFFKWGKHWVGDPPGAPTKAPFEIITRQDMRRRRGLEVVRGEATVTFMMGGFVGIDGLDTGVAEQLPTLLVLRAKDPDRPAMLDRFLAAMDAANEHPGTRDLANDLIVTALFGAALHVALTRVGLGSKGLLGAGLVMFDPNLGPVLRLMHDFPERPWTMESLADEAGLSRSSFHERFVAAMKVPPMAYLRSVRLGYATQWLRAGVEMGRVAKRAGYTSVSAFTAAFRREFSIAPSEVVDRAANRGTAPPSPDATQGRS